MKIIGKVLTLHLLLPFMSFGEGIELNMLDLDELMNSDVQLTSVMRRIQSVRETGASAHVLSGKEILNSGVTSIPQALTLVPGLQVRQVDNNLWAITSRSTASRYASKLLVMIDGQSIYDPIHAGVNWETIHLPLVDIERIEVIRGQGSLLWGSNATNGVINIITKHSEDTRGLVMQAATGNQLNYDATARFGSDVGTLGSYRIHVLSKETNSSDKTSRSLAPTDSSDLDSIGGRLDLNINDNLFMLIKGQYQRMQFNSNVRNANLKTNIAEEVSIEEYRDTYNFTSRIEHVLGENASQMLQLTYANDDVDGDYYKEQRTTYDVDYQMNAQYQKHQFDWGVNYRYIDLDMEDTPYVSMLTDLVSMEQYGVFVQLQLNLIPDSVKFTIGNKSEHNEFTGWEHQPVAKLVWLADQKNTFWTSISRGVRTPSLIEYSMKIRAGGSSLGSLANSVDPILARTLDPTIFDYTIPQFIYGNQDVEVETSVSEEIGYRYADSDWNIDASLFYTQSKNVISYDSKLTPYSIEELTLAYFSDSNFGTSLLPVNLSSSELATTFMSGAESKTYGGELIIGKKLTSAIKIEFSYNYTNYDYQADGTSMGIGFDSSLQQVMIKTTAAITTSHSLFAMLRFEKGEAYSVKDFYALDLSWKWQVSPKVQFGITGNNLLGGDNIQFYNTAELYTVPTYIQPYVTANVMVSF